MSLQLKMLSVNRLRQFNLALGFYFKHSRSIKYVTVTREAKIFCSQLVFNFESLGLVWIYEEFSSLLHNCY